jgi:hypothetical protein
MSIPEIPLLESTSRKFGIMSGTTLQIEVPNEDNINIERSSVSLKV